MRRSLPFYSTVLVFSMLLYGALYMGAQSIEQFVRESARSTVVSLTGSTMTASGTVLKTFPVTRIIDGDTIEVRTALGLEKVRLLGIDTPETKRPGTVKECYGEEAAEYLSTLLKDAVVELEADITQDDKDRYGRLLRYVRTKDTFINLRMIEGGFAYEYTYQKPYTYQRLFRDAEKEAQRFAKGLWEVCPSPLSFISPFYLPV